VSLVGDRSFRAVILGHLIVDLLNAERPLLLAVLSVPLGLTNALIGLVSLLHTISGSFLQPAFGWLADRIGPRPLVAGGILWITVTFALAVVAPGPAALLLLILGGIGSAAFHPAGAMEATRTARAHLELQETTAASLFFLLGQIGFIVAPAVGGPLLDRWGPAGLLALVPFALPTGLLATRDVADHVHGPAPLPVDSSGSATGLRFGFASIAFATVTALQSWAQTNMVTYLPKYYSDLGFRPSVYGLLAATFMVGTALGGLTGGWLGDRASRRWIVSLTLASAGVPLALYPSLGPTAWGYVLALFSGALTGASWSILIVHGQKLLPGRRGVSSGLIMGFAFASGSLGTLLSGIQADRVGFSPVFLCTAAICVLAGVLALFARIE
jgi:FSR family fosmidomycin resistance protein-like MFS transporter